MNKLKRKYGDRAEWTRVTEREFVLDYFDENGFKGYVTLLRVIKVNDPLFVQYEDKRVSIVDNGYTWLQHFPEGACHSVTTMFDAAGEVVQWYIDICCQNGIDNGRPWIDDLFLDLILLPTGEIFLKDADELESALKLGVINKELYQLAVKEADSINEMIKANKLTLLDLTRLHKDRLVAGTRKGV